MFGAKGCLLQNLLLVIHSFRLLFVIRWRAVFRENVVQEYLAVTLEMMVAFPLGYSDFLYVFICVF